MLTSFLWAYIIILRVVVITLANYAPAVIQAWSNVKEKHWCAHTHTQMRTVVCENVLAVSNYMVLSSPNKKILLIHVHKKRHSGGIRVRHKMSNRTRFFKSWRAKLFVCFSLCDHGPQKALYLSSYSTIGYIIILNRLRDMQTAPPRPAPRAPPPHPNVSFNIKILGAGRGGDTQTYFTPGYQ